MIRPQARPSTRASTAVGLIGGALVLAGCSGSGGSTAAAGASAGPSAGGPIAVVSDDKTCQVASTSLPAGTHTFKIDNKGSQITEFYVYAAGDRVMGEVENIGPFTGRTLVVELDAGSYQLACKPGMLGKGIRQQLTVTGQAAAAEPVSAQLRTAVESYRRFVQTETKSLLDTTTTFTAAVKAGDQAAAKAAYPAARLHYERIEPIAESFGDLDPRIDMRIDDVTAGKPFVGFHRIEQDLWQKKDLGADGPIADQLLADVTKLADLVKTVEITPIQMGNGAKELLDEVAKSKVTGEEERYSRIDLLDFIGNVEGSRYAYSSLRPTLAERDPELVKTLDTRFEALVTLLDTHRQGAGVVSYDSLTPAQIKALSVEVAAISEPLGRITAVIAKK